MRPPWAWPSLSSQALKLKGVWKPHVAVTALPSPSVPFYSFGKWFHQLGSGKMFLDPDGGRCSAQPVDVATPRLWGRVLPGLTCKCSVWEQQPCGPGRAHGLGSGSRAEVKEMLTPMCQRVPLYVLCPRHLTCLPLVPALSGRSLHL